MAKSPRELALRSIVKWEKLNKYVGLEACSSAEAEGLTGADRGLYFALVLGVAERAVTLDHIISEYVKNGTEKLEPEVKAALRLGLYQLTYMDRIPPHAAVSETVALVPRRAAGLVNAVLREYLRRGKTYRLPGDPLERLSVTCSVPAELCRFLIDAYGEDVAEKILHSVNGDNSTTLHVNTLKTTVADALETPRSLGADARVSGFAEDEIIVASGSAFLDGIAEGLWFVQDEASAASVDVLSPVPGSTVVDTCAAPGGKSFACALKMKNEGKIFSFDIHENKLSLIRSGALRLGIDIITADTCDARSPREELEGKADFVVCDAPCSGLGVIRKKPDIRYKNVDEIARLPEIQYASLCGAAEYVREGGTLTYSTCTLNPEENENVVTRFIASHPEFSPVPFDLHGLGEGGYATLFPHETGTDGFFVAKMKRRDGNG